MFRYLSNRPGVRRRAPRPAFRPGFEALEDRYALSTVWTVTSVSGDVRDAGSLPNVVATAQSGDTIRFDTQSAFAKPVTITLSHNLDITKQLTIAGPGQDRLTLTGSDGIVFVEKGGNVTLTDLTVGGCNGGPPPVENYRSTLTLRNCAVRDNTLQVPIAAIASLGDQAQLTVDHCTVAKNQHAYIGGTGGGIYNEGALTVRDSTITDNTSEVGGGIYNAGHTRLNVRPTIVNTTISGNHATLDGGGIYDKGDLLVDDGCQVSDNTADRDGGGIYLAFRNSIAIIPNDPDNSLTVCDSTVSGNRATGQGGGVYADSGALIHHSTLSGNEAHQNGGGLSVGPDGSAAVISSMVEQNVSIDYGGGIFTATEFLTVSFSTIRQNAALLSGGGVYVGDLTVYLGHNNFHTDGAPLEISYSTLAENYADWNGGGLGLDPGDFTHVALENCTVAHNTAPDGRGGGVYVNFGHLKAVNSTIAFNEAFDGGGLYNNGLGFVDLESATVAGNSVQGTGGGVATAVFPSISNPDATTLKNTIVAGNHSVVPPYGIPVEDDVAGPIQTEFSNLIQSTAGATITAAPGAAGPGLTISIGSHSLRDIYGVDPRLGPLQDNGGPTQTMALGPGSPAIGAGDPTSAPRIDQRGLTRAGGGFDDSAIDIGAYATQTTGSPAVEPIIDCDGSSVGVTLTVVPAPANQPGIVLTPPGFPGGGPRPVGGIGGSVTVVAVSLTAASPAAAALAPAPAAAAQPAALDARAVDQHFAAAAAAPAVRTALALPWGVTRVARRAGAAPALDDVFAQNPVL
jgi:predicted outer membrane repeat protein